MAAPTYTAGDVARRRRIRRPGRSGAEPSRASSRGMAARIAGEGIVRASPCGSRISIRTWAGPGWRARC
eukprot:2212015-Pyramimonas_sp.AAC.1